VPFGVKHYKKEVEFRLRIDHKAFKHANTTKRREMICKALIKSLEMFPTIGVKDVNLEKLLQHVVQTAAEHGWLQSPPQQHESGNR
jgi:hypothetical protein